MDPCSENSDRNLVGKLGTQFYVCHLWGFHASREIGSALAKSIILARQNALYIDLRKNLWTEVTKTKSTSFPLYQILGFVSPTQKDI
jgi:hypothetical protein